MQIIGVGLHRGGTGKTTTALHLAAALGESGRKCLLMDLDGNLGLTDSLDVPTNVAGTYDVLMREADIDDVILSPESDQERATRPGEPIVLPKNVHFIPGNRLLTNFEADHRASKQLKYIAAFDTLTDPIHDLEGVYDYVILDTAPAADTLTIAAYKNAHWFLIAATPTKLAVNAVNRSLEDIDAAREVNPKLAVLGVLMGQFDARKKTQRAYLERVRRELESDAQFGMFDTVIPLRAALEKASTLSVSLFDYDPAPTEVDMVNELRDMIRALGREVEARITAESPVALRESPLREEVIPQEEGRVVNG